MANIVEKILEFTSHKVIDLKSFCLLKILVGTMLTTWKNILNDKSGIIICSWSLWKKFATKGVNSIKNRKTQIQINKLNQKRDDKNFFVIFLDFTIASVEPKSIKIWLNPTKTNAIAIIPKDSGPNILANIMGATNVETSFEILFKTDQNNAFEFTDCICFIGNLKLFRDLLNC